MSQNQKWEKFEDGRYKNTPIKWWWQRVTRGYDDRDVWNLNIAIIDFVTPRIKHYITWQCEHGMSCPEDLDPASWLDVLRKIETAFDQYSGEKEWDEEEDVTAYLDRTKEGIMLFGKYLEEFHG